MTTPTPTGPAPDELAIAVKLAEIAAEELEAVDPRDGASLRQAAAIRLILSRPASQEETIRADGEALRNIVGRRQTCASDEVEPWELQHIARSRLSARQEGGGE